MKYKLIVVDMDGTLLNNHHDVSEENKRAIKEAINRGVEVAIATGRIFTSARYFAKLVGTATPIIACNGALIRDYHNDEVIYCNTMNKEDVLEIIKICKNHKIYFQFYDQENFYTEEIKHNSLKYYQWNLKQKEEDQISIIHLEDALKYLETNDVQILKLVVMDENLEKLEKVRKEIAQLDTIEIVSSWFNNIEIMNKDVSKGQAIEALGKILGIEKSEIIAFGDNYNDLSMKKYSETFVAMGNGEDYVLQQADYITDANDEDGVAKGIRRIVFEERDV